VAALRFPLFFELTLIQPRTQLSLSLSLLALSVTATVARPTNFYAA